MCQSLVQTRDQEIEVLLWGVGKHALKKKMGTGSWINQFLGAYLGVSPFTISQVALGQD